MSLLLHIIATYIKENIITKLQKSKSPPREGNKSPELFVIKPFCKGDLLPARKIFIERPVYLYIHIYIYIMVVILYYYTQWLQLSVQEYLMFNKFREGYLYLLKRFLFLSIHRLFYLDKKAYPENVSFIELDVFQFVWRCWTTVNTLFTQYSNRCLIGF